MPTRRTMLAGTGATVAVLSGCLDAFGPSSDAENQADQPSTESESSVGDRERREKILSTYDDGVVALNSGVDELESGSDSFSNENFSAAISAFDTSREYYEKAEQYFSDAVEITIEIDNNSVRDACETAREHAILMRDAVTANRRAADAMDTEEYDRANDHLESTEELIREAERLNIREPDTIRSMLGLG